MKTLVVVDMQNDFIDGVLGSPEAQAIVPKVAEFIRNWDGKVVYTMDTHYTTVPDSWRDKYFQMIEGKNLPLHCEKYTKGWCIEENVFNARKVPETDSEFEDMKVEFVEKASFGDDRISHFVSTPVRKKINDEEYTDREDPEEVVFIGLCTDICVISNALMLRSMRPKIPIKVIADLCAGSTPENHEAALKVMKACQIEVV